MYRRSWPWGYGSSFFSHSPHSLAHFSLTRSLLSPPPPPQTKLAEHLYRKQAGLLEVPKAHRERMISTQKVPHSYTDNGEVCFGDTIQLMNSFTGVVLASNVVGKGGACGVARNYSMVTARPRNTSQKCSCHRC